MSAILVHQIYYNETTRLKLDPGFIPLDNTSNERPDWYELWPIRRYLHETILEDGKWYGFVSPKFLSKVGLTAWDVGQLLVAAEEQDSDLLLLSPAWHQVAYFKNEFEQGERWHPGLRNACQRFAESARLDLDLDTLVTHSCSAVYSNYVIAKRDYWNQWLILADQLLAFAETYAEAAALETKCDYYGAQVPLKAFVQERLPAFIIAHRQFRIASYFPSDTARIGWPFIDSVAVRRLLQICDEAKRLYTSTGNEQYLSQYWEARRTIPPLLQ